MSQDGIRSVAYETNSPDHQSTPPSDTSEPHPTLRADFAHLDDESVRHGLAKGKSSANSIYGTQQELMDIKAKTMYRMVTGKL